MYINPSPSKLDERDIQALKVSFRQASSIDWVIPAVNVKNYLKKYEILEIDSAVNNILHFLNFFELSSFFIGSFFIIHPTPPTEDILLSTTIF
ncbi:hypothetical protein Glove_276g90 [Diversispora epigaea]|uniref:Uncharacterized protein n=1 Tax=Diversispora epigaea TaxID=1348612 RepID=A0A397I2U8_9GLOM|nr:hypothetical protein Glove_276g90 [Diversispora epigaea]